MNKTTNSAENLYKFIINNILTNLDIENKEALKDLGKTKSVLLQELSESTKKKFGLETFLQCLQYLPNGALFNIKDRIDMYFEFLYGNNEYILNIEEPKKEEKAYELSEEDQLFISEEPLGKMYMYGAIPDSTYKENHDKVENSKSKEPYYFGKKSNTEEHVTSDIIVRKKTNKSTSVSRLEKAAPLNLNLNKNKKRK